MQLRLPAEQDAVRRQELIEAVESRGVHMSVIQRQEIAEFMRSIR